MGAAISRFLFYKVWGWTWTGWRFDQANKYVVIVIPHTSNWDFLLGLLVRRIHQSTHIKFLAKSSLFRWPFGGLFRALGGYPVNRKKSQNYVDAVVELFDSKEKFAVTIAPEGTRSKVDRLKTGFYYIALGAKVPIVMVKFDYGNKVVEIAEPFHPSGDKEADFAKIHAFFRGTKGKNPAQGFLYEI